MRPVILLSIVMLTACGPSGQEEAAQNAQDVAEVRANQAPPPEQLQPQPILYPDIEENDLFGAGCNFAPQGGGMGAIAMAKEDVGYMKRNGQILTFASDKGSARQPLNSYRKYDGRNYGFTLELLSDEGEQDGIETVNFPARLIVRDGKNAVVYEAEGTAQCGS